MSGISCLPQVNISCRNQFISSEFDPLWIILQIMFSNNQSIEFHNQHTMLFDCVMEEKNQSSYHRKNQQVLIKLSNTCYDNKILQIGSSRRYDENILQKLRFIIDMNVDIKLIRFRVELKSDFTSGAVGREKCYHDFNVSITAFMTAGSVLFQRNFLHTQLHVLRCYRTILWPFHVTFIKLHNRQLSSSNYI